MLPSRSRYDSECDLGETDPRSGGRESAVAAQGELTGPADDEGLNGGIVHTGGERIPECYTRIKRHHVDGWIVECDDGDRVGVVDSDWLRHWNGLGGCLVVWSGLG